MTLSDIVEENKEEEAILKAIGEMDASFAGKADKPEKEKPKRSTKQIDEQLFIYDSLLTQKFYEETFNVGKKISGMWRSRTTGQSNTIYKLVDAAGFNSGLAVNNYLNLLNMSYSLVVFNGEDLREKSVSDRLRFLESMPEALIISLSKTLVDFDSKISAAVEVGRENF